MSVDAVIMYEFTGTEPPRAQLQAHFPGNISRLGVPFFVPGSESEKEFLAYCAGYGAPVTAKRIGSYHPPAKPGEFVYLSVKSDHGACIPPGPHAWIDRRDACPGTPSFGNCEKGARQIAAPTLSEKGLSIVERLGFCVALEPVFPVVFLITSAIADLLQLHGATGCEFVECRLPSSVRSSARVYQLKITGRVHSPAYVGNVRIGRQCPVCRAVSGFLSTDERSFAAGSLSNSDFQIYNRYSSENLGEFQIVSGIPIVSARMFDILLQQKLKGIVCYSTEPPVQHGAVIIR